jgi:hypothetical protein
MNFEPLILRLSLIRLGTLFVLIIAIASAILTFFTGSAEGPGESLIWWLAVILIASIAIAFGTITLRIDTTGLWLNSPVSSQHFPWASIELAKPTGRRPFLGVGLVLKSPSPARKAGIDYDFGPFWGLPNDEFIGILTECLAVTKSVAK